MANTVGFIGGKFLPVHSGHVYAITKASKLVDELYVIVSWSDKRDKLLCEKFGNMKVIPPEVRCSWLGEIFAKNPIVKIINIEDKYGLDDYNWEEGAEQFRQAIGKSITHVFSGEKSYKDLFLKLYPEAEFVLISEKNEFTISATTIRNAVNLFKYWTFFPKPVQAYYTKKILITGTESCGKSILTENLANIFNTAYVHEIGRDYCEQYSNQLTLEMFDRIAMEHYLIQEEKKKQSNKILFVDSDAVVTQYYLKMYHARHSEFIDKVIQMQSFDLVFYLEPDVKWVEDGYRFAGDEKKRIKLNNELKELYQMNRMDIITVKGDYESKFNFVFKYIRDKWLI